MCFVTLISSSSNWRLCCWSEGTGEGGLSPAGQELVSTSNFPCGVEVPYTAPLWLLTNDPQVVVAVVGEEEEEEEGEEEVEEGCWTRPAEKSGSIKRHQLVEYSCMVRKYIEDFILVQCNCITSRHTRLQQIWLRARRCKPHTHLWLLHTVTTHSFIYIAGLAPYWDAPIVSSTLPIHTTLHI